VKIKLLVTGILVGLAVAGWFIFRPGRHSDASAWKNSATPASARLRMADDLVNSQRLLGLTRQEVVTLLGDPPKTEYFKEFDFVYYVGPERGFMSIDSEWLLLKFDADGPCLFTRPFQQWQHSMRT
jgi:hypothetical protein